MPLVSSVGLLLTTTFGSVKLEGGGKVVGTVGAGRVVGDTVGGGGRVVGTVGGGGRVVGGTVGGGRVVGTVGGGGWKQRGWEYILLAYD